MNQPKSSRLDPILLAACLALMGAVFVLYSPVLFTEANNWFFVCTLTDAIRQDATREYLFGTFAIPNALFHITYMGVRTVLPGPNSYMVAKGMYFCVFALFACTAFLLSRRNALYAVLLPLSVAYPFTDGMVNYYLALALFLVFFLALERWPDMPLWALALFAAAIYSANFMPYFIFSLFILLRFGFRKTFLVSLAPGALFLLFRMGYVDNYHVPFLYSLQNHFSSLRRVLLPAIVDIVHEPRQYAYAATLNAGYLALLGTAAWTALRSGPGPGLRLSDRASDGLRGKRFLILGGMAALYFALPAALPHGSLNIHERILIPCMATAGYVFRAHAPRLRTAALALLLLLCANTLWSHMNFDFQANCNDMDYIWSRVPNQKRGILNNRSSIGRLCYLGRHALDELPVDEAPPTAFTSSIVARRHPEKTNQTPYPR